MSLWDAAHVTSSRFQVALEKARQVAMLGFYKNYLGQTSLQQAGISPQLSRNIADNAIYHRACLRGIGVRNAWWQQCDDLPTESDLMRHTTVIPKEPSIQI
jgi:hypothetical protein